LSSVSAHMNMAKPVPRGYYHPQPKGAKGAPKADGGIRGPAEQLCKGKPVGEIVGTYKAGSTIDVEIEGTAPHDGGHCQFAISYDDKTYVVIKDVMKDCADKVKKVQVQLPDNIPSAKRATFAWAWINAGGQYQYYMNCADIAIEGSENGSLSGKKLLVANILGGPRI
ncbi:hypothetical protein THASP1DRAFT_7595, partial [Thamnocephalis sphaerospora]